MRGDVEHSLSQTPVWRVCMQQLHEQQVAAWAAETPNADEVGTEVSQTTSASLGSLRQRPRSLGPRVPGCLSPLCVLPQEGSVSAARHGLSQRQATQHASSSHACSVTEELSSAGATRTAQALRMQTSDAGVLWNPRQVRLLADAAGALKHRQGPYEHHDGRGRCPTTE